MLEWYNIGSMEVKKVDKDVSCNKSAVLQAGSGSTAKHNFEVENECETLV